ncbi:hypothetical protein AMR72_09275 [Flavobacterium psychrophilum]|nr:hypothetical protein AMR72_09275 [Flavobacterium psychrophilum]AOE52680.1 hypothetical protein ALW18_09265 [Flavobacterium psychrophilum]
MVQWYLKVVKENYANFSGRARRSELWYFMLVNFIISAILGVIDSVTGIGFLAAIYGLAVLVPSIAVGVRRLHDIDKETIMIVLAFIPVVNFYVIYLWTIEGVRGPNKFGPDPKAVETGFSDLTNSSF